MEFSLPERKTPVPPKLGNANNHV